MKRKLVLALVLALLLTGCIKSKFPETIVTETVVTTTEEETELEEEVEEVEESESVSETTEETKKTYVSNVREGTFGQALLDLDSVVMVHVNKTGYTIDNEELYTVYWEMPLDHDDPNKGTFEVRMVVRYFGDEYPNVFSCCGYDIYEDYIRDGATNALMMEYRFNYFEAEYRFYGKSIPDGFEESKADYVQYLNCDEAASDFYEMVTELKTVTSGKWTMCGGSKGGMLTVYQEYVYPDTADLYIAEVSPLNIGECNTVFYENLYTKIGDLRFGPQKAQEYRDMILALQVETIRNRDTFQEKYWEKAQRNNVNYTPKLTKELVYDMAVLDIGIMFWQYDDENILEAYKILYGDIGSDYFEDELYDLLITVSAPDVYEADDVFVIQCCMEEGYNAYDFSYLRDALEKEGLSDKLYVTEDMEKYLYTYMVSDEILSKFTYDDHFQKGMMDAAENGTKPLIIINGNSDVWAPYELTETDNPNTYIFNVSEGAHLTDYSDLGSGDRSKYNSILSQYGGLDPAY